MTRQTLDTASDGWIRIGRGSLRKTTLIVLTISAGVAIFITAPMMGFGPLLFGTTVPVVVAYLVSILVVFSLIAPLMLPRASRPLLVDSTISRVKVGLRTSPVDELRHAYRVPDPEADGRFQLKLGVRGLDALIGISLRNPPELSSVELDALIALIERAPIEPDPAVLLRPPVGGELGARSAAEAFDDALNHVLLPYEVMSFAKPTLLRELQEVRGSFRGIEVDESAALTRDIGLVAPGRTNAPERQAALADVAAQSSSSPAPGFWAMQSSKYRAALSKAESWLQSASNGQFHARRGWQWSAGLAIVIVGFVSPWVSFAAIVASIAYLGDNSGAYAGPITLFLLGWPFIAWAGFMLMWRARIDRFQRARQAALEVRRAGTAVERSVSDLFAPPFPEVGILSADKWHTIVQSVILLVGGLTVVAVGNGTTTLTGNPLIGLVVGTLMVLASAVVFAVAVRSLGGGPVRALRAHALWTAITSEP